MDESTKRENLEVSSSLVRNPFHTEDFPRMRLLPLSDFANCWHKKNEDIKRSLVFSTNRRLLLSWLGHWLLVKSNLEWLFVQFTFGYSEWVGLQFKQFLCTKWPYHLKPYSHLITYKFICLFICFGMWVCVFQTNFSFFLRLYAICITMWCPYIHYYMYI